MWDIARAVLRLLLDLALIGLAVWGFTDGTIPTLLDATGGRWAWMAGGAVAFLALDELAEAATNLRDILHTARQHTPPVPYLIAPDRRPPAGLTDLASLGDLGGEITGECEGGER